MHTVHVCEQCFTLMWTASSRKQEQGSGFIEYTQHVLCTCTSARAESLCCTSRHISSVKMNCSSCEHRLTASHSSGYSATFTCTWIMYAILKAEGWYCCMLSLPWASEQAIWHDMCEGTQTVHVHVPIHVHTWGHCIFKLSYMYTVCIKKICDPDIMCVTMIMQL